MRYLVGLLLAFTLFSFAPQAQASGASFRIFKGLSETAGEAGYVTGTEGGSDLAISAVVGNVINLVLSALGTIAVLLILYAGYLWMTAGGNEDQISKSKTIIKQVAVGLIVLSLAYAIVSFVVNQISTAGGGESPAPSSGTNGEEL